MNSEAIETLSAAIFAKPGAWVAEAYSEFDQLPKEFLSAEQVADYIAYQLNTQNDAAHLFVAYPDMGGRPERKTIELKPGSIPNHTRRYTWNGWGLIQVLLSLDSPAGAASRVAANSKKRALHWEPTDEDIAPVSTWNWKAVESHTRRLKRILSKVT